MSTFEYAFVVDQDRHIDGAVIVLGALLRSLHPADAAARVAQLLAEAKLPADLTLLGETGDADRFARQLDGKLRRDTDGFHLGSGCYGRVLEASDDDAEVLA